MKGRATNLKAWLPATLLLAIAGGHCLAENFFTITPCRLLDTRLTGERLNAGVPLTVQAAGKCGIPAEATAVAGNLTVVGPADPGHFRLLPAGTDTLVSALNFSANQIRANNFIIGLSPAGQFSLRSTTSADAVIDVNGYFAHPASQPTVTGFAPSSGPVGTSVVIAGTKSTGTTSVKFNVASATFLVNSDTQITATVPAAATSGPISVTTSAGTGASASNFNITAGAATKILVETKSDGTGMVVPAQNVPTGSSLTVYAIGRDASNNFVANSPVNSWSLAGITGGVAAGDLVPVTDITEFPIPTASSYPNGIAAGPDGNLWFTDGGVNKIGRITPAGVITEFAIPTGFAYSSGIAAGPDGNLWFAENGGNKIGRITPAGVITEFTVPTASSYPFSIAAGPDGNLWFTEADVSKIGRITPAGVITEFTILTAGSHPYGIAAGSDGNLWFAEYSGNKIGRITPAGVITEFTIPTLGGNPFSIAAGPDGNLWFTEGTGNKIGRITPAAVISEFTIPTDNSSASRIAAGPDGNLWFTEYSGNKIGRITPAGVITEFTIPTGNSGASGIAAGPDGSLWFAEYGGNKIGRLGSKSATFTGHLAGTAAIHAARTSLASTDSGILTVVEGTASKLMFATQPTNTAGGSPITPAVTVQIQDANGNVIGSTASVTVAIGSNPGGGTLSGTLTRAAVAGVATFSNLSIDKLAMGYTLTAASTGLTGATSSPFDIGTATKIRVETASDGSGIVVPAQSVLAGSSLTVYAVGRDANNNFVANVTPDSWSLASITGGVISGDLLAAGAVGEFPLPAGSYSTYGIAAGPDGNIWYAGGKIGRITPAGAITEFPLPAGSIAHGIAAGADGNLWFTELGNNKIGRIPTAGVVAEFVIPTASSQPYDIAAGPDGNLWFTEFSANKIGRITTAGVVTEFVIPTASSQPYGIAPGPDGNLWFTEFSGNKIGRITTAGVITEFAIPAGGSAAAGIAAGPDGNLWFAEYSGNKIGRITPAGVITEFTIPTALSQPYSIAAGPDGNLWFTEYSGNKIGRITPAGVITEFTIPTAYQRASIAAGPDGNLWFTEYGAIGRMGTAIASALGSARFTAHKAGTAVIHAARYGLTFTDSGTLTVPAGAATKLAFAAQPSNTVAGSSIRPAVTVQILDPNGNVINSSASVAVAIGANPAGGTLSGTATAAAVSGVATFNNLSIDKPGIGYTLTAASAGLTGAISSSFTIRPGAATKILVETASDGSGTVVANQSVASGSSLTVYAISRDANNNFVGNVTPDSWSLASITGGVVPGDLVAGDGFTEFPLNNLPTAIAAGPDGNIWFTEYGYGGQGQYIAYITPAGAVTETLYVFCNVTNCPSPKGLAAGPDGHLWYTGGLSITRVGGGLFSAGGLDTWGITAGPDGNIWFTEYKNDIYGQGDAIGRITPAGGVNAFPVPTAGSFPYRIAAGPDGNLWFTENAGDQIGRITPAGVITEFMLAGGSQPAGIAAGPDGNIWFTEYNQYSTNKIGRITPAGVITEFPLPDGSGALNIVAGPDGNLWFTEYGGNRIGRITPAGAITEFPAGNSPADIAVGSDGKLWFTESGSNKIGRMGPAVGSATFTGHQLGTAVIHAAKAGLTSTDSGTVTVTPAALTLSLNPAIVNGGDSSTGTVTLASAAPTGGAVVTLSSSNSVVAAVPPSVTVAQDTTTATFPVMTLSVPTTTYVTLNAVYAGVTYTATLTLTPAPALLSLTPTPLSISGGSGTATGTVTLAARTPGDIAVNLASSHPGVVLPATVTVPANSSSATFPISVPSLAGFTNSIITASRLGVSKQAMLTRVVPHIVTPVADGQTYTYRASAPVPFSGWAETVNGQALDFRWVPFDPSLAGTTPIVLPSPTRITMTPNTSKMRLVVTVAGVAQPSVMDSVDACAGSMPGSCAWTSINLNADRSCPYPDQNQQLFPSISGLTNFVVGQPPTLTATAFLAGDRYSWVLEIEDPAGSARFRLVSVTQNPGPAGDGFSSANQVWTPKLYSNVDLGPGRYRVQVLVARPDAGSCYTRNGSSALYLFNVLATIGVADLILTPANVVGGNPSNGTVVLNSPAPFGGLVVVLSSSSPSIASVPGTVAVPEGASAAPFTVNTVSVGADTPVTISASANGTAVNAVLSVLRAALSGFTISRQSVVGGMSLIGHPLFTGPLPPPGATVTFASSNPSVVPVPADLTVAAGLSSGFAPITTNSVGTNAMVTISATWNGTTLAAVLIVTRDAAPAGLFVWPADIVGGNAASGRLVLNSSAPPGGAIWTLTSSNPAVAVPATVTVPEDSDFVDFPIPTTPMASMTPVTISATYAGSTLSSLLNVLDVDLVSLILPSTMESGDVRSGTVTLNHAPTVPVTVYLESSDPTLLSVPESIELTTATADFPVHADSVQVDTRVSVSASLIQPPPDTSLSVSSERSPKTASLTYFIQIHPPTSLFLYKFDLTTALPPIPPPAREPPTLPSGVADAIGTVYISRPAPVGGITIALYTNQGAISHVPPQVTIAEGRFNVSFTVTTDRTARRNVTDTISAQFGPSVIAKTLRIVPNAATISYYMDAAALGHVSQLGCNTVVRANALGISRVLVILDFGAPKKFTTTGEYGAMGFGTPRTTAEIAAAVQQFGIGTLQCASGPPLELSIAVGTNNSRTIDITFEHGEAWARMIKAISSFATYGEILGAGDWELQWSVPDAVEVWLAGFNSVRWAPSLTVGDFLNFGNAEGCQLPGLYCAHGWLKEDLWLVSWGEPEGNIWPLPEIYSEGPGHTNAKQWTAVSLWASQNGVPIPWERSSRRLSFRGALAGRRACIAKPSPQCKGAKNTPAEAWAQLYDENAKYPALIQNAPSEMIWSNDITWDTNGALDVVPNAKRADQGPDTGNLPEAQILSGEGFAEWRGRIDVRNAWRGLANRRLVTVLAGSVPGHPSEGVVLLLATSLDGNTVYPVEEYRSPTSGGGLQVLSSEGVIVSLRTEGGSRVQFHAGTRRWITEESNP